MIPKGPPPRLPNVRDPSVQAPLVHPSAQTEIDNLNQSLQIQKIPIPQYQFEQYTDWAQLDRSRYDAGKMENVFICRFRGCKDWSMPQDNRGPIAKMWHAIVDKVANVFGKSDVYIDQYDTFYTRFQKAPSDGKMALPK